MTRRNGPKSIRELHSKAEKALKKAVIKALARHEAAGIPAAVWKNGKVVYLPVAPPHRKHRGE